VVDGNVDYDLNLYIVGSVVTSMLIAIGYGIYSNYFNDRPFPSRAIGAAIPFFTVSAIVWFFVDPRAVEVEHADTVREKFSALITSGASADQQVLFGCILIFLSLLVMAAISIVASTRLATVVNILVCSAVFVLGLLSSYLFRDAATQPLSPGEFSFGAAVVAGGLAVVVGGLILAFRYLSRHISIPACIVLLALGGALGLGMETWLDSFRQSVRTHPYATQDQVDKALQLTQRPAVHILALPGDDALYRTARRQGGFVYLNVMFLVGAIGFGLSSLAAVIAYFAGWRRLRRLLQIAGGLGCLLVGVLGASYLVFFIQNSGASLAGPRVLSARMMYHLLPDLQTFWIADLVVAGRGVTLYYLVLSGIYAALYVAACLVLAVMLFRERQLA
jgi:hypothetical protein